MSHQQFVETVQREQEWLEQRWPQAQIFKGSAGTRDAGISGEDDMGFIASDAGSNFKRVPAGAYIGRCYSLIDLGTQLSSGQYGEKLQHKLRIGWELFGEDEQGNPLTIDVDGREMPLTISKSYTVSLHEKSGLRRDLAAWRGKDFSDDEAKAFDVSKLLGAYALVNVTTSETNGKTYSNVAGLTPLPAALKNSKPAPVHDAVLFDLDKPDMAVFSTFHEKLQEAIKRSPEWAKAQGSVGDMRSDDEFDADPPF